MKFRSRGELDNQGVMHGMAPFFVPFENLPNNLPNIGFNRAKLHRIYFNRGTVKELLLTDRLIDSLR